MCSAGDSVQRREREMVDASAVLKRGIILDGMSIKYGVEGSLSGLRWAEET